MAIKDSILVNSFKDVNVVVIKSNDVDVDRDYILFDTSYKELNNNLKSDFCRLVLGINSLKYSLLFSYDNLEFIAIIDKEELRKYYINNYHFYNYVEEDILVYINNTLILKENNKTIYQELEVLLNSEEKTTSHQFTLYPYRVLPNDVVAKLQDNVYQWYCKKYPEDNEKESLSKDISFLDIIHYFNIHGMDGSNSQYNLYDLIGVNCDSLIRERIFQELENITQYDYSLFYNMWLNKSFSLLTNLEGAVL